MELSHEVQTLLSHRASYEEIFTKMVELYHSPRSSDPYWTMLPAYAVHYDHPRAKQFFDLTSSPFTQSKFNHLITAVMEGKQAYILDFALGFMTDDEVVFYDNKLGEMGCGIISDGVIQPIQLSPMDIILAIDDIDSLKMFSRNPQMKTFHLWEIKALLKICKQADAKKCIRGLQDMLANCPYFNTDTVMADLISFAAYLQHYISDLMCNYIIHFRATMMERYGAAKSKYLTKDEVKLLKDVVNGEAPVHGFTKELLGRVILDTCVIILDAKKNTKSKSLIAADVILGLTENIGVFELYVAFDPDEETASTDTDTDAITFLKCTVTLTQMCFQHGVESENVQTRKSAYDLLDGFTQVFPSEYNRSHSKVFSLVCEQLRILVVTKYIEIDHFMVNITNMLHQMSSPHLKYLVRTLINMMPQHIFEKYRMNIKELEQKLKHEESKNPDTQDKELVNKSNLIIANCSPTSGIRSLQELCRVKVHEFIPEGQLPAAAHKLEIPAHVQKDLACWVTPK